MSPDVSLWISGILGSFVETKRVRRAAVHPFNRGAAVDPDDSNISTAERLTETDPSTLAARVSIDMRRLAWAIVTLVVVVFALQWTEKFFIPVLLGILIAYTLNPLVVRLERLKISRVLGTSLVMLAVLCAIAFVTISLRDQMQAILDQVPKAASQVSVALRQVRRGEPNTIQKVQAAARELDKAASQAADVPLVPKQPTTRVVIDQPAFKLGDVLWAGSRGLVGFLGQAATVLILVFFLLLSGDTFKHKLVRLTGPVLSEKKITLRILDEIHVSIQSYMFMLAMTNMLLALLIWVAFLVIGLDNAGAWAIAAGVLHVVPYLGPALIAIATGVAGFMQFESFSMALLVAGSTLAIATFVGMFVMTWMTSNTSKMNAAAVFVSIMFWTWLWGAWGLLLAIPISSIMNAVAQHIEELQPLAELLRDENVSNSRA